MFFILCVLAALISAMFVASVISTVTALRREQEEMKMLVERSRQF
ncbi:hypothetical protein [Rhizobium paknamense]|uniref:Uncharacterized protein n=1 Tax=Rhizobium paknamense TaxID=1206817 RepID=A0ABU0I6H7_9HYPH|nr:hypothetical protein [Rhizobium paknamense]MDQ0453827.1 hypothetical protein [Rhizobium paknamense]